MIETFRATGNDQYVEAIPAMLALELGGRESSEAIRQAWVQLSEGLGLGGQLDLFKEVAARLEPAGPS